MPINYILDQGLYPTMILSSTYFGLKKHSQALDILYQSIDLILSSDDQRVIAKSLMQFFKTIRKSLDPKDNTHDHFEQIYKILDISTSKFIPYYDVISLQSLYEVLSIFRYSYVEFINFSPEAQRLDIQTITILNQDFKRSRKKKCMKLLMRDLKPRKKYKN